MPLRRRLKFEKWKTPEQVKRLNIDFSKRIGRGNKGDVYVGRLFFNDGSSHRVAVKKFNRVLTDDKADRYNKVIRDLAREGVPLPKMGMVKWKGEWYQVSQLFGSTKKGSKITDFRVDMKSNRDEYINIIAKTINAGYALTGEYMRSTIKGSTIPIDLDAVVGESNIFASIYYLGNYLRTAASKKEQKAILEEIIRKVRNPKHKKFIAQYSKQMLSYKLL